MPTTAERVRRARTLAGLSQIGLAAAVGVKRSAVAQWERRDGCLPSMQHLVAVAKATGVQVEWLGTGEGEMGRSQPEWCQGLMREDYAQDDLEADCLVALRSMPIQVRKQLVTVLKLVAKNY